MQARRPRRISLTSVFICIVTAAASAQTRAPDAETVASIRRLIHAGDVSQARERLKPFDAGEPLVAYLTGLAAYHADDHETAIATLQPVVAKLASGGVERREAEQVLGLALYAAGRLRDALPYVEATRAWAGDNTELHYFLGLTYLQTGNVDAGRSALAISFGVPADRAAAHLVTAQMLMRLNLDQVATGELKRALEKDARLPQAQFLLGQIALFRGRLDESAQWTRAELDVNPGNAMAWYQLGDVHIRQSKWDVAIPLLQRSLWLNPFYSGPYILLGRAYMKTNQPATAEGMLRRAIQYDPNNRTAHYMLAQLLQQTGRDEEAKAEFAIAEKLQGQPGRP